MTINTPAFPTTLENHGNFQSTGLSIRDYFAAKALTGMLADSTLQGTPDEFARRAYSIADAMILARDAT